MSTIPLPPGAFDENYQFQGTPPGPGLQSPTPMGVQPQQQVDQRSIGLELIRKALEGYNIDDYGYGQEGNPDNVLAQQQGAQGLAAQDRLSNRVNVYDIMQMINPQGREASLQNSSRAFDGLLNQLAGAAGTNVMAFGHNRPDGAPGFDPSIATGLYQDQGAAYQVRRQTPSGNFVGQNLENAIAVHQKNQERVAANPEAYAGAPPGGYSAGRANEDPEVLRAALNNPANAAKAVEKRKQMMARAAQYNAANRR